MKFKSKSQIMKTYNSIAEHFDVTRYKPWPETMKFAERLEPGSHVLDIGCGNGRNSRFLASKGMSVIGIDFSNQQIKIARGRGKNEMPKADMNFQVADAVNLPFDHANFDAVLYIATLHHLTGPDERLASMTEIHRCLKPGGSCLVSAWGREQEKFYNHLAEAKDRLGDDWEPGDMLLPWNRPDGEVFERYYHLFSKEEFRCLLASTNFEALDVYESFDNHYALLRK